MDPRWYNRSGLAVRAGSLLNKAALLRRSSMLVFGGGSVFREMGPLSEKRMFALHSRLSGHPLAALGVSVGPFRSSASARRLLNVLHRVSFIGVRDSASADLLAREGYRGRLVRAGDLAALLPAALGESAESERQAGAPVIPRSVSGRPRLGVTLLGVDYEVTAAAAQARRDTLIDAVVELVRAERVDVTIFVFNGHPVHGDGQVSQRLRRRLDGLCDVRMVGAESGVRACWAEMRRCDLGLHMRLHGAIFSYLAGVPFALVPYQRKCDDFLDEIGQAAENRIGRFPEDPTKVTRLLAELAAGGTKPAVSREELADRAVLNFTEAPWARGGSEDVHRR